MTAVAFEKGDKPIYFGHGSYRSTGITGSVVLPRNTAGIENDCFSDLPVGAGPFYVPNGVNVPTTAFKDKNGNRLQVIRY